TKNEIPVDDRVTALAEINGDIWIGLYQGGLKVLDRKSMQLSDVSLLGLRNAFVTTIVQDKFQNSVWVGTYNSGVFQLSEQDSVWRVESNLLKNQSINIILQSSSNELYFVALKDIYRYETHKNHA